MNFITFGFSPKPRAEGRGSPVETSAKQKRRPSRQARQSPTAPAIQVPKPLIYNGFRLSLVIKLLNYENTKSEINREKRRKREFVISPAIFFILFSANCTRKTPSVKPKEFIKLFILQRTSVLRLFYSREG